MPQVEVNGTRLSYADDGHGRPLVFIPGLGASHGMFDPQLEPFRATHRLIRPDLRGNGDSGRLTRPVETILDRQCDDVADLLDHLGIEEVVMIGVSYGGVVAMHFALRHPTRLAGLMIVDTFADIDRTRVIEFLFLVDSYLGLWVCYLPKLIMKALARRLYRRWPVAQAAIPRLVDQFRPTEAILQSLAMNRANDSPHLDHAHCPALGIVGDATRIGVRFMERAVRAIAGARLEIVHDSFDPTNLCQPETFNRLLASSRRLVGETWITGPSYVEPVGFSLQKE